MRMKCGIFKLTFTVGMVCVVSLADAVSAADAIDFARDIAPIFEEHCWHCHGEDEQQSGLRLDQRAAMLRGGDYGQPTIVPFEPDKSYLLDVVNHREAGMEMPPDEEKIPSEQIELLTRWIKEGAHWPGQMEAVSKGESDHWSFQPLVRPNVPPLTTRNDNALNSEGVDESSTPPPTRQVANPIDAFLLDRLSREGLTFSEPADARVLIRRASIVLTGLAPTPEATHDFATACADAPAEAYEQLVDRLLESPHFGERWAQHWLDVIRWAETNGSESNLYRKNAWVYRDYVIRSFNDDKPYDRFLFEQIAGDTVRAGEATGYLVSGPHVPVATVGQEPAARRQARADRMDEILQTIGASALGVTIGCARCHNHKFDPISIQDYYAMSAVFQDIEFGSRFPELADDHPRQIRGQRLTSQINRCRSTLREMGPWEEDWEGYRELHFPPTTTDSVRITFLWNSARIDELEIFGTRTPEKNLALAAEGTRAYSPEEMQVARNELHKINDGQYGTEAWVGRAPVGSEAKPWVQFTFSEPHEITRIRLSTNREDFLETDYLEGMNKSKLSPYRIEMLDKDGTWKLIFAPVHLQQLDKKHETRAASLEKLQELIQEITEEGPQPSFVGRFVTPVTTHVFGRGSPENPREEVVPAGLEALDGELNLTSDTPGKRRRTAFANWLTSPTHPLTARVAANRLWHHVFGEGIVTTASDFGSAGAPPTHPELLDWLAAELMKPSAGVSRVEPTKTLKGRSTAKPWSMKHLIRLMVTSRAFRQSSVPREDALAVDADSALLWRFPPRRMTAEAIRDTILQASGSLDRSLGGRSYRIHNVKKRYAQWAVTDNHGPDTWRRMIYQERMRRVDDRMFTAFDFPDCGQVRGKRPVSTTPLQALNLLNSDFVIEQSRLTAERATRESGGTPRAAVDRCFELLLLRKPSEQERDACLGLAEGHGLALVCRAILNSNEFAFIP